MRKRVVITGYALVTPLGSNVEQVWTKLCNGCSGITHLPAEIFSGFRTRIGGACAEFDPTLYIPVKETKKIDRFTQFALVASIEAVKRSELDMSNEDKNRFGVIIGSGVGGLGELEVQHTKLKASGPGRVSPFAIPKIMPNAASGHVSMYFGINGPSFGVVSACASSNNAMIEAFRLIREGELDVAITGGTEAALTELGVAGFGAMRALSERNDEPEKASRPFDVNRDGFVLSEGAGILILEELEHAQQRGAQIFGEFLGYGITSDASHVAQPDNGGTQAGRAMAAALKSAQVLPEQIDYINAHGTSTSLGDVAETAAIKLAFGEYASKVSISSTKSQVGHLLAGSGGVELIFSLMTIRDGVVPPTINLEEADPLCDLDFTPLVAKEKKVDLIMSNSFGFGGHNACLVVGRFVQ